MRWQRLLAPFAFVGFPLGACCYLPFLLIVNRKRIVRPHAWKAEGFTRIPFEHPHSRLLFRDGLTISRRRVFYRKAILSEDGIEHEGHHIRQIERYGWPLYLALVGWQLCWYGYKASPLERRARAVSAGP